MTIACTTPITRPRFRLSQSLRFQFNFLFSTLAISSAALADSAATLPSAASKPIATTTSSSTNANQNASSKTGRTPAASTAGTSGAAAPTASSSSTKVPANSATTPTVPSKTTTSSNTMSTADSFCTVFAHRLPNVTEQLCSAAELLPSTGQSVKGRTIFWRDIVPTNPQLKVIVIGGIHGDELSSSSVALRWLQLARDPAIQMPQSVHWRFIPALNPDGILAQPPRRMNANGVDLNRNFPTPNWEQEAKNYWENRTRKDPRRWPGVKPLSEPESKFMFDQMASFKPNLIVSIHAPYGVLDFDGPSVPPSKLGRLFLDQVGIYPGSLGNYGGVQKGVPVVTVELPNSQRTPLDAETRQMWLDLLRWMSERIKPQ